MLYATVDFSHERAYESKQRVQHSSWEQPPLMISHCPDVREVEVCQQGHVYHCPYECTQGGGWQGLKAVPVWMGHASQAMCGLEETVWLCTYPLHRLPIFGLFPFTWGLVMPGLQCCNFDGVILPCLW